MTYFKKSLFTISVHIHLPRLVFLLSLDEILIDGRHFELPSVFISVYQSFLSLSLSLSLSSNSLQISFTLSHSHSLTPSLSHPLPLALSHFLCHKHASTKTLTHTHNFQQSLYLSFIVCFSLFLSLSLFSQSLLECLCQRLETLGQVLL